MMKSLIGIFMFGLIATAPNFASAGQINGAFPLAQGVRVELASIDPNATLGIAPSTSAPAFSRSCTCADDGTSPKRCHVVISVHIEDLFGRSGVEHNRCESVPGNADS